MNFQTEITSEARKLIARRWFLKECGVGLGGMALASLLASRASASTTARPANPLAPRLAHYTPKAKRVISLFMAGAPSHLDLFDYKPELAKRSGETLPGGAAGDAMAAGKLLAPRAKFAKHGRSGVELSEWLPELASVADELCV